MDTEYEESLRRNHTYLIKELEPKDILGQLYEDGILTENDCELIERAPTRKQRCQELLSLLPRRGPSAYGSFRSALIGAEYHHLLDALQDSGKGKDNVIKQNTSGQSDKERYIDRQTCDKCSEVIPNDIVSSELRITLFKHCCVFTKNLDPLDVVDEFFQETILTSDEYESVRVAVTRKARCQAFFRAITQSASKKLKPTLMKSLHKKYRYILERLQEDEYAKEHGTEILEHDRNGEMVDKQEEEVEQTRTGQKRRQESGKGKSSRFKRKRRVDDSVHVDSSKLNHDEKGETSDEVEASVTPLTIQTMPKDSNMPTRKILLTFNTLSSLINQGQFDRFEHYSNRIREVFASDSDMMCLLGYLHASRNLFQSDFASAKQNITDSLAIAPRTSNAKYFILELLTARTRMYLTQKKMEKLQNALDDAKMIIEADPVGCSGRAAGWLYMNDARNLTAQIGLINWRNQNAFGLYEMFQEKAEKSMQRALVNFRQDGGKDGPFGFGFALCRLAMLLCRCGDAGLTMNILDPPLKDIKRAGGYLQQLEDSASPIPKILEVHFLLARCDYQFRRNNPVRALEYATSAHELATLLNMQEFIDHALNRLVYLRQKAPLSIKEIDEDEMNEVLFGENVETISSADTN